MIRYERALDIEEKLEEIINVLGWYHIIDSRIICVRSFGAKSKALARIWSFPKIWQTALEIGPFYVIEFLSENYDKLSEKEKIKTIIHELLHIPKRFSGGLVSHKHGKICEETEEKWYREYKRRRKDFLGKS